MAKQQIELGNEIRDIVSGFQGIAMSKTTFLNGCVRWGIQPKMKGKEMPEEKWFDEHQIEYVGKGVVKEISKKQETLKETGGPQGSKIPKGIRT